jgi:GNAT superfamily N-acetyltransferase
MPDARRIEEAGLNALQSQQQLFYDGWLLRVAPGKAKRARSVNAHFGSTLPLARKLAYCEEVYAARGLPLLFRITPFVQPPTLDAELAAQGYDAYETTLVQSVPLERPPVASDGVEGVVLTAPDPPAFAQAVGELRGSSPEHVATHLERLVNAPLERRGVIAMLDGRPVGTGAVGLEDGLAGVFDLVTAEQRRGRGIATVIVASLLAWAWERASRTAYLQVSADNAPAIACYRKFGFATQYTYHYRGRPGECR